MEGAKKKQYMQPTGAPHDVGQSNKTYDSSSNIDRGSLRAGSLRRQ
jgi:hypothetical protein